MPELISTYLGRVIDILNPKPEDIGIKDIAHHLSLLCRFTGACRKHYSVAQHSVFVMHQVPDEFKLEALLHDAAEAYLGDLSRPVKQAMRIHLASSSFDIMEDWFRDAITTKFNLNYPPFALEAIHQADMVALATERRDVCSFPDNVPWPDLDGIEPLKKEIEAVSASMAEYTFLIYFKQLMEKRS